MFKVSQQQTQNQPQRNKDEDSIIISGFTSKWEICEFLTNSSFKIFFSNCYASIERNFSKLKLMNSAVQPTIREDGPTNPSLSAEYKYAKEIYEVGQIYTRLKNSVMLLFITAIDQ